VSGITRRSLLQGALAGGAAAMALGGLARRAGAIGPGAQFRFGELTLGGAPPRPTALSRLGWELEVRTSVDVAREVAMPVSLGSEKLFETPFLYLAGDKRFPLPGAKELESLRRFLTFGGFLLVDSAEGRAGGDFDAQVRQLAAELFPQQGAPSASGGFQPLPDDHVIFKSFYLITSVAGRVAVTHDLEAVIHDGRAVIVYSQNDLGGAWAKDNFGNFQFPCYPGGETQREHAFRLGINLAMYALCLDYKTDQVHVPFILKRRKWKAGEP
jgi:hypothetical protein